MSAARGAGRACGHAADTGPRYGPAVLVSVVVHLVSEPLEAGRVVGRAECVATGEQVHFQGVEELVAFLRSQAGAEDPHRNG